MTPIVKKIKDFLIRTSRDVLIIMVIGLTISLVFSWGNILKTADIFIRSALYSLIIGLSLWKVNELFSAVLEKYYPWHKRPRLTLLLDVVGTILISAIIIYLVNYYFYFLISNFNLKERPQLFILIGIIQLFISLVITSVFYVIKFFKEWRALLINEERLKREALTSQYESLKSYVNPHFLFNSLSVLDSLIDHNPEKAKDFIGRFSDVYRYVLQQKDRDMVPLPEELAFAQSYVYLNKIRQGAALQVEMDVQDQSGFVVPVSLQILLENAFKHNEASVENPLKVTVTRIEDELVVVNTYQPRKVVIDNQGIGLKTICRRYEQLTNQNVNVVNAEGFFKVCLPIINNIEDV